MLDQSSAESKSDEGHSELEKEPLGLNLLEHHRL